VRRRQRGGPFRATAFSITSLLLVVATGVAGCQTTPGASPAVSPTAQASLPPSPVDGVIVSVDSSGLADVRGFTLRMVGGRTIVFKLGPLENPTQFPPGHLKEHEATAQPVRVYFVLDAGVPTVYRLEDAPGSSPPPTAPAAAAT
jgi:predicted small secreted protein